MPTIAAVCTGNTCRSSMAEGFLKELLYDYDEVQIISAGTAALAGQPAAAEAIEGMRFFQIDISNHRSQSVDNPLMEKIDLLIAMTVDHAVELKNRFPVHRLKIKTIGELIHSNMNSDISDPVGQSLDTYWQTAEKIKKLLAEAKHEIVNLLQLR